MQFIVKKTFQLTGKAYICSSKSHSIRGLLLALLTRGTSSLENVLDSDDTETAKQICKQLGAKLDKQFNRWIIKSEGIPLSPQTAILNAGDSGITTLFTMPLLGLRKDPDVPIVLDCGDQMKNRPVHSLIAALRQLGMTVEYLKNEYQLPARFLGSLKGGKAEVEGVSSQYLSSLLLALPCAPQSSEIWVQDLHERPYVDMTLNWLKEQNIEVIHYHENYYEVYCIPGNQSYSPFQKKIPGDFSSASYFIAAALLKGGEIELHGLDMKDPQGDKQLIEIMQKNGADISINSTFLKIKGGRKIKGSQFDVKDIPDLLPILAVIGTCAEGKTEIKNIHHTRLKETDRVHSISEGLSRLGAHITVTENNMTIYQSSLKGAYVKGYHDHRTVMALTIAGLLAEGETIIDDAESITKTFPNFVTLLQSLGAHIRVES